ncbi:hypothetical protein DLM46_19965 [Paraburkholderia lacunae]|uniref:Uncharacterized protein n=1 Tax=Paraburkholderia lacunae TaxID=2211104 RepID=A0A370N688_9BURK|nr:hypothetical protein DLM46_19965 [Paraburkholderia lacunae]
MRSESFVTSDPGAPGFSSTRPGQTPLPATHQNDIASRPNRDYVISRVSAAIDRARLRAEIDRRDEPGAGKNIESSRCLNIRVRSFV